MSNQPTRKHTGKCYDCEGLPELIELDVEKEQESWCARDVAYIILTKKTSLVHGNFSKSARIQIHTDSFSDFVVNIPLNHSASYTPKFAFIVIRTLENQSSTVFSIWIF